MADANWTNQTMWTGDNLPIMRGMNSESVDLIYLDPPFNSNANYAAPVGSMAAGAEFKDTWSLNDVDIAWLDLIEQKHPRVNRVIGAAMTDSDKSYLIYMAARLLEMHRILKPTGSIYLHCDPEMSHYLKLLMDAIFGRFLSRIRSKKPGFRNEVVWCYKENDTATRHYPKKHDCLLFYVRSKDYTFNIQRGPITEAQRKRYNIVKDGKRFANMKGKVRELKGGAKVRDWWDMPIVQAKERTHYPTQKPLALLDRIIQASSNEGDMVLDPFAGCATACVSANNYGRKWVGIDVSQKAYDLVRDRIQDGGGIFYDIQHRTDVPKRTDLGPLPKYNCAENKSKLYGEQGGDCAGCGHHFMPQNLTVDHIIARSVGGTDHIGNLQLLCGNCNSIKGNRGMEYLLARLRE